MNPDVFMWAQLFVMQCDKLNACFFGLPMIDTYNGWDQQHY